MQGFQGLDGARPDRGWYGWFAAAWAVAVLVGIVGLSIRRFVLRPQVLGGLSLSSGIVAVLIAALMVTYLLGWRALEAGGTSLAAELVGSHAVASRHALGDSELETSPLDAGAGRGLLPVRDDQRHARFARGRR